MLLKPWKCLIPAFCILFPYCDFAAAAANTPVVETVVVSASRAERPWLTTPAAATSLGSDSQLPGLRIDSAELLQGMPGLQVDSRSNFAQDTRLVLRGFGARSAFGVRGMAVRLDNIPLSMPDGQAQLGSVLLDEVASVEVLRGPLATLYGNGAGGVVRLTAETPTENELRLGLSAGNYSSRRENISGTWRNGRWGARVQANQLQSDGFRTHSAVERQQGGMQLYYDGADGLEVTLRLDASRDPETLDPSGLTPGQWREDPEQVQGKILDFNTRKALKHRQASINVDKAVASGAWQLAAWQGRRDVDQWLAFEGAPEADSPYASGGVVDLSREFQGVQGSYRHDATVAGNPWSTTLGVSIESMDDRRRGYVNNFGEAGDLRRDETGSADSRDIFALAEWQPLEPLTLLGGLRHSRVDFSVDDYFIVGPDDSDPFKNPDDSGSLDFNETSAAIGASFKFTPQWVLFGSVGLGFETPTLTEMAYRNQGSGLNRALEPSRNRQLEAGIRFSDPAKSRWALTAFNVDSEDELVVDQSLGGRTTYHNAAATQRYGVEFEGDWQLAPAFSARGSATWLDAEYSEGEWSGNRLPGVAKTQAYAQLRWLALEAPDIALTLAGRYRSSVASSDDNLIQAPDYITFDLALSSEHRWRDYRIGTWARIENIADETYVGSVIVNQANNRSFEPAAGRTFMVGVEVTL